MTQPRNNKLSGLVNKTAKKLLATTAMTAIAFSLGSTSAKAADDWSDHVKVGGDATITIDNTTIANTTNITQIGHRVKVQGDGDIKAGWTVNVNQDTSSSQYILFDVESDPTLIRGNLNANGEIYIFDNQGVIFSANSKVDVGSIVASSGNLASTDAELDAGKIIIDSVEGKGDVINRGEITVAEAGLAGFVAPNVTNNGVINATMGKVAMAAGDTVTLDLYGDGLVEIAVGPELSDGLVRNSGEINARGGQVKLAASVAKDAVDNVINMSGAINASSATVKGGKIILSGGDSGKVRVAGDVWANGTNGQDAGSIEISGENVTVTTDGDIRARSTFGGTANAGDIEVIADDTLIINGEISALGLVGTGDIETSAPNAVFGLNASVLATRKWLLDPTNIIIDASLEGLIEAQLGLGDMTVQTPAAGTDAGDIGLRVVIDWATDNTFELIGANDVFLSGIGGGINAAGAGNFVVNAGDDFRMNTGNASIITNGGDVTITTADEVTIGDGFILAGGGNITIDNNESFEGVANSLRTSGTGTITLNQNKDVNGNTATTDPSIQNAIDAISNTGTGRNTVNVGAGTWAESVNANIDNLTLNGSNAGISAVDGVRVPETIVTPNSPGFLVTADDVVIDGFTVDGAGADGNNGIETDGVNNFTAVNNILTNNTDTNAGRSASNWTTGIGILVNNSTGNINLSDNDANNNTDGIRVQDSDTTALGDIVIRDNSVSDNDDKGVIVKNSDNVRISANEIANNKTGVWLEKSSNGLVNNNDINDSTENGIRLRNGSNGNELRNNRINGAGHNGIYSNGSSDLEITVNTIRNVDGDGILLENLSSDADINGNRVFDAVNGIKVTGGSTGSDIIGNTVINSSNHGVAAGSETDVIVENIVRGSGHDGIAVINGEGTEISENTVTESDRNGISILDSNDVTVQENTIRNSGDNGVDVRNSDGTDIKDNIIRFAGLNGIYVNPSDDIRILDNTITDTGEDGIHSEDGLDIRVRRNTIRRTGDQGIDITGNDFVRVTDNTVTDTGHAGISVKGANGEGEDVSAVIADNTVRRAGRSGIVLKRFTTARITDNIVTESSASGVVAEDGDNLRIRRNLVRETGRDGINVDGVEISDIRDNKVKYTGWDGININNFGDSWIAYNDVSFTGNDGIEATNGNFVSIYDNYVEFAGYVNGPAHGLGSGNEETDSDDFGNDGIHVRNVGGGELPSMTSVLEADGFGTSKYGSDVEIYGNEIAITGDDGVEVRDSSSTYIADNLIGHTGADGIEVISTDVTIIDSNSVSATGGEGITVFRGTYAGVFDNRVLLTGDNGILVSDIYGGIEAKKFGDTEYGYGWSVNVSGNEIAMTAENGISVHDSGATKIQRNNVFMAGMGGDLGSTIGTINEFAAGTFSPVFAVRVADIVEQYNGFEWNWGNGHGINVDNIEGAYFSPNGWAVDVRGNNVRYTGGHGINVEDSDRTRIANNRVRYAGIDYTGFQGADSLLSALSLKDSPFDSENEGRRDLWLEDGSMVEVLDGYFGIPAEEPTDETPYLTITDIDFDSHDGIHAEDIYGQSSEGLSGNNYLYDLRIVNNTVRFTGDDGIEVDGAGRTLIADNTIRHSGFGNEYDYGSGDYYGADGIHVRNVSTGISGGVIRSTISGLEEGPEDEGYNYEPARNYALIIRNNDVRNTSDDGIEVVGGEDQEVCSVTLAAGRDVEGPEYSYYGHTDRVLIAENTVRRSGVVDSELNKIYWEGSNIGPDGLGHDGIHVRGIQGNVYNDPIQKLGPGGAYGDGYNFYGYAADVINNDVRRTGDDGIEVINSSSTLILGNTVRHAGVGGGYNYGGGDYYGADGIHVRSVGGLYESSYDYSSLSGSEGGNGFEPYAVAIVDNDVRRTQDDGIEVVGNDRSIGDGGDGVSGDGFVGDGDGWVGDGAPISSGTGRTLIKDNIVRGAGAYFDLEGPETLNYFYGDGFGADGIHVRGVQNFFGQPIYDGPISAVQTSSGGPYGYYGYDVQIIDNNVKNVADDGVEVRSSFNPRDKFFNGTNVLVEGNTIENSGDNGISLVSNSGFFKPIRQDDEISVFLINPFGGMNSDVIGNTVINSDDNGLYVQGGGHNNVVVSDNTFTDFDTGATFESGLIDLTGDGNTFEGGRVGMRFAPTIVGFEYPEIDTETLAFAKSLGEPIFSSLALVDDDGAGGFGGTIGEQTFDGQSEFYVELDNGAFFNPGTPTILNALDSTYVGTPFGTVTPSVDFPAGFSVEQLAFFEDKFYHFNDDGTLGLFFFPLLPEIDQEDIFQFFGPNADALGGLNVTILGLPGIPGGSSPVALNNIAPAAGGDPTSPEALNAIATAAGGDEQGAQASCFSSGAIANAGSGQPVNISYGGNAEDLLNGEANCGS